MNRKDILIGTVIFFICCAALFLIGALATINARYVFLAAIGVAFWCFICTIVCIERENAEARARNAHRRRRRRA
jgi:hypothetical protein